MAKKNTPIYQPGFFGNFFYYFLEIANLLTLLFFVIAISIMGVMYLWAMADADTVPLKLYDSSSGPFGLSYQLQSLCSLLFLWLFIYNLKQVLIDFFSAKETVTFKISHKDTQHISGNHGGYTGYFIYDRKNAFEVGSKTYEKLGVGNTVTLIYTKVQHNVRRITLVK